MLTEKFTIKNKMGLHMRPANILVNAAVKYSSDISIIADDKKIDAKSIMNIMAACIKQGSEIVVECSGDDEKAAMSEISQIIENGFGEE